MKRIIAAACAAFMIAATFTSCYDPVKDPNMKLQNGTTASTQATTAAATEAKKAADYKDDLAGLRDYMKDKEYITIEQDDKNVTKMKNELIGAKEGYKYSMGDVLVELYEFNLSGTNAERDKTLESVKKNGSFTIYSKEVKAYLTDSGKYMMVYYNNKIDENNKQSDEYKKREAAIKAFKEFEKR